MKGHRLIERTYDANKVAKKKEGRTGNTKNEEAGLAANTRSSNWSMIEGNENSYYTFSQLSMKFRIIIEL